MRTVTEAPGDSCPFPFTLVRRGPNWIQGLEILLWLSGDPWGCEVEGRRAGQVSSLHRSVPVCIMGALGGLTCKAVKARTFSPSPTHQLSLLSSGQGEPLPLPAALRHL